MSENEIAEYESSRNHAADIYFDARPQIFRTREKELLFDAGFERAYQKQKETIKNLRSRVAMLEAHKSILADHMAEVKAISGGCEVNTLECVVNHCINEIDKLMKEKRRYMMAVIDYRGFCISAVGNPTNSAHFDYAYWHNNYDGTPEDGRRGHGCSVFDCQEQIDEMIDGDGVEV